MAYCHRHQGVKVNYEKPEIEQKVDLEGELSRGHHHGGGSRGFGISQNWQS